MDMVLVPDRAAVAGSKLTSWARCAV